MLSRPFFFLADRLLLHLNIDAVEGNAMTKAVERLGARNSLQHHELLEEMGTEAVATIVDILIYKPVVGVVAQHGRTVGGTLALSNVARGIAHLEVQLVLACSTKLYTTAHHRSVAGIPDGIGILASDVLSGNTSHPPSAHQPQG